MTVNKFKSSNVAGVFQNIDLPDGSVLASAFFERDVTISGSIVCTSLDALIATKADIGYVDTQVAALVGSSPVTLDTLNELGAALGNDPNFATSMATSLGGKLNVLNPNMSGSLTLQTPTNFMRMFSDQTGCYLDCFNGLRVRNTGIFGGTGVTPLLIDGTGNITLLNITSPTITNINTQITTKANIVNPSFTHNILLPGANGGTNGNLIFQDTTNYMRMFSAGSAGYLDVYNGFRVRNVGLTGSTISTSLTLDTQGNMVVLGTLASPTITSLQSQITALPTTTNLTLKADKSYVDSTFATTTNLALKADKTYVDSTFATTTNLALKADIGFVENKYATITNLATKANSNTPFLTTPSITGHLILSGTTTTNPTWSTTHGGALYFSGAGVTSMNSHTATAGSTTAFSWQKMLSYTTVTTIMDIRNDGNLFVLGTISSPTITDLQEQLNSRPTTVNMNLKADKSYVDSTFGTIANLALKADKTYVDSTFGTIANLALKADKTYVDSTFATTTNLALKADIGFVENKYATITNLATKANSNAPFLTTPSITGHLILSGTTTSIPTWSTTHGGALYFSGAGVTSMNSHTATAGSTTAFSWQKMLSYTTVTTIMDIRNDGNLFVLGTISSPTITTINTTLAAKADSTALTAGLASKADLASPTFSGTVSGISKAMVGLANVDNTTDAAKPVSSATSTALNLKSNSANPVYTGSIHVSNTGPIANMQYYGTGVFGGMAANLTGGNAEVDFFNTGLLNTSLTNNAFNWYLYTSQTTKNMLLSINNNGNMTVMGTIASPTISTINASITTINTSITTINTSITTINTTLGTKQDILSATNRLDAAFIGDGSITTSVFNFLSGVTSGIQAQFNSITASIAGYATSFTTVLLKYDRRIGRQGVMNNSNTYTWDTLPEYISVQAANLTCTLPQYTTPAQNGSVVYVYLNGNYGVTINVTNQQIRFGGSSISNQNNFYFTSGGKCKRIVCLNGIWNVLED